MDSQPPFGDRNYVQQYFDTRVAYRPVQLYGYGYSRVSNQAGGRYIGEIPPTLEVHWVQW